MTYTENFENIDDFFIHWRCQLGNHAVSHQTMSVFVTVPCEMMPSILSCCMIEGTVRDVVNGLYRTWKVMELET